MALGPMLRAEFQKPVFINNDGNLFVYGEAIAGFLPYVNTACSKRRATRNGIRNLFGVTLGTGLGGGGVVIDGRLLIGDNSIGGEAHLLRHVLDPWRRRGGRRVHPRGAPGVRRTRRSSPPPTPPSPRRLPTSRQGRAPGNRPAAREAFRRLGEVAGDALAQGLALIDGLAVDRRRDFAQAHALFLPGARRRDQPALRQGGRVHSHAG